MSTPHHPGESSNGAQILIVDDDADLSSTLSRFLVKLGYRVSTASTGAEALQQIENSDFDAALIDNGLPDCIGLTLIPKIKTRSNTVVFIMTGYRAVDEETDARLLGASDFFSKPFDLEAISQALSAAIDNKSS